MPSTNIPIWPGVIRYYWDLLPVKKQESIVTLHEGNTPLLRCRNLERKINPVCGEKRPLRVLDEKRAETVQVVVEKSRLAVCRLKEPFAKAVPAAKAEGAVEAKQIVMR